MGSLTNLGPRDAALESRGESTQHPYSSQGLPNNAFPLEADGGTILVVAFCSTVAARAGTQNDAIVFPPHAASENNLVTNIREADVDEEAWCVECCGVQVGDGYGKMLLLAAVQIRDVLDIVEGHGGRDRRG